MKYRLDGRSLLQAVLIVICSACLSIAAAQSNAPPLKRNDKSIAAPADKPASDKDKKDSDKKDDVPRPAKPSYFLASQVDWVPLVAPPPAVNSPEQQRDLQMVLEAQASNRKGSARRELAVADTESSCFRIIYALDPKLEPKQVPKAAEFLKKAAREGDDATGVLKAYWQRARPFVVSEKVERLGDIDPENIKKKQQEQKEKEARRKAGGNNGPGGGPPPPGANGAPPDDMPGGPPDDAANASTDDADKDKKLSPEEREKKKLEEQKRQLEYSSYPSGHSTYGTLCAIFLAEMLPEKQAEVFKRADEYRQSRLIVGAHFPSDVEAGRIVATAAAAVMSQNFAFQRDLAIARVELRTALGLPAELPAREKVAAKNPEP